MPPEQDDLFVDWKLVALAHPESRDILMVHRLQWKAQPSATRICRSMVGAQHQRIANRHQDKPA